MRFLEDQDFGLRKQAILNDLGKQEEGLLITLGAALQLDSPDCL